MFNFLGRLAAAHPWKICAGWVIVGTLLTLAAPRWEHNAQDDDIGFLPARCDSVRGYRLLSQAFPKDVYASRLIFAVERQHGPLLDGDMELVDALVHDLRRLAREEPSLQLGSVCSCRDAFVGKRLLSGDRQCGLIQVDLGCPYLALQTMASVDRAEAVVQARLAKATAGKAAPPDVYATGAAGVGRDLTRASANSLDRTTLATIVLVVVVLLLVHRSPLLALVPLLTIGVSVWVALNVLALFTLIPGFYLVNISQVFAVVMLYGAGTDYCLFLISRYREELAGGKKLPQALAASVNKVGGALAASAATVVCGLGLMGLAEFAKVRCGGPAIALSLAVALAASLTLAPALLQLLGKAVFWPHGLPSPDHGPRRCPWERISRVVVARPLAVWSTAVLLLLPLALVGSRVRPNYRATGELSPASSSIHGLEAIRRHFTPGETGPITVLLASHSDWNGKDGREFLSHFSQALTRLDNVAEVRSLTQPLGVPGNETPWPVAAPCVYDKKDPLGGFLKSMRHSLKGAVEDQTRKAACKFYLAKLPPAAPEPDWLLSPSQRPTGDDNPATVYVTRLDVVPRSDPFDPKTIPTLDVIRAWVKEELPKTTQGLDGLQGETYGVTVSGRDLALITESDRARINVLVLAGIFLILLVLVRKPWLAGYLLATVLFSYYATLGATTLAGHWVNGRAIGEVDWRVPFFLFTILVAVGEDYNILLITRALKERRRHGGSEGMRRALARTGGTITSCGLIMAGTFATLMLAGLGTLIQIGFALAFGVLLDTFIVRPFLVPALTVLVWRRQEAADTPAALPLPTNRNRERRHRAA